MTRTLVAKSALQAPPAVRFGVRAHGRAPIVVRPFRWLFAAAVLLAGALAPSGASGQTPADYQELQRLSKRYVSAMQAGKFPDALAAAQENLRFIQRVRFPAEVELASYEMMARPLQNMGRYREALPYYDKIIAEAENVRAPNEQARALMITMKGNAIRFSAGCYERMGDVAKAADMYRQSVDFLRRRGFALEAAEAQTGLGWMLQELNRSDEALAEFKASLTVLAPAARKEAPPDHIHDNWANALWGISWIYEQSGRYDLAEPYKRQALSVITTARGWRHPTSARIAASLADIYFKQARYAEAEPLYGAAIEAFKTTSGLDNIEALGTLNNCSRMLAVMGRYAEAEPMVRFVIDERRKLNDPDLVVSLVNLANMLSAQGKNVEAEPLAREALSLSEKLPNPESSSTAQALRVLVSIRHDVGDNAEALKLCDRALDIYQRVPTGPGHEGELWGLRAICLRALGRNDEAQESMQKAIKGAEMQRAFSSGGERERAISFTDYSFIYDTQLAWQADDGSLADMFATIESMKARSFVDELQISDADLLAGLPPDVRQRLTTEGERLRQQLAEAESAYNQLADAPAGNEADADRRRQAARAVLAARDALYDHTNQVQAASPVYRELLTQRAEPMTLAGAQQELVEPGELMFSYHVQDNEAYLVIVSRDAARYVKLSLDDNQARLLGVEPGPLTAAKLSEVLTGEKGVLTAISRPDSKLDPNAKLAALWTVLVPEQERKALLDGSIKLLTVLPDGPLALLPFEALIVDEMAPVKYLLDAGPPIVYAPSATVLDNLAGRKMNTDYAQDPVLTLGDPAYPGTRPPVDALAGQLPPRSARDVFRSRLARLPYSGREAAWVEEHFKKHGLGCVRLTAADATEARLRSLVADRQIVHLACHGMAEDSFGNFFGCLALTPGKPNDPNDDGFLYAAEICKLPLAGCELAILSACETNYGPQLSGEGVWNLSRAFLVAGARRVVASNWVVDDEAGATLMSYFTAELAKAGDDPSHREYAAALQKAKRAVRGQARWSNPFYWSSLVLVGPR